MALAVVVTLYVAGIDDGLTWGLIVAGVAIGGTIGAIIARRIPMTAMPQLVAAFHSLVGMAAVLVAASALYTPEAYGIGIVGSIKVSSLVEMSLGVAIGAVTFTGSIVAFTKLQGLVSGAPMVFPGQHPLNALLGLTMIGLIVWLCATESHTAFWALGRPRLRHRRIDHHSHRWRRHAGGDLHAQLLLGLGGGGYRIHAGEHRADHHRRPGRFFRRDSFLHHVQGHEPVLLQRHPRRLRWRDQCRRARQ